MGASIPASPNNTATSESCIDKWKTIRIADLATASNLPYGQISGCFALSKRTQKKTHGAHRCVLMAQYTRIGASRHTSIALQSMVNRSSGWGASAPSPQHSSLHLLDRHRCYSQAQLQLACMVWAWSRPGSKCKRQLSGLARYCHAQLKHPTVMTCVVKLYNMRSKALRAFKESSHRLCCVILHRLRWLPGRSLLSDYQQVPFSFLESSMAAQVPK